MRLHSIPIRKASNGGERAASPEVGAEPALEAGAVLEAIAGHAAGRDVRAIVDPRPPVAAAVRKGLPAPAAHPPPTWNPALAEPQRKSRGKRSEALAEAEASSSTPAAISAAHGNG